MNKVMGSALTFLLCAGTFANATFEKANELLLQQQYLEEGPLDPKGPITVEYKGLDASKSYPTGKIYYNDVAFCGYGKQYRYMPTLIYGVLGNSYSLLKSTDNESFHYGYTYNGNALTFSSNIGEPENWFFYDDCGKHEVEMSIEDILKKAYSSEKKYGKVRLTIDRLRYTYSYEESIDNNNSYELWWLSGKTRDWADDRRLARAIYYVYLSKPASVYQEIADEKGQIRSYGNLFNSEFTLNYDDAVGVRTVYDIYAPDIPNDVRITRQARRYTYSAADQKYVAGEWFNVSSVLTNNVQNYKEYYDTVLVKKDLGYFARGDSLVEIRDRIIYNVAQTYGQTVVDSTFSGMMRVTPKYKVQASKGNGGGTIVTVNDYYKAGETVSLKATANAGYLFDCWESNGVCVSKSSKFDLKVRGDSALTAFFIEKLESNTRVVTFVDFNDVVLGRDTILTSRSATAPNAPVHKGLTFKGWDKAFDNVTENITVRAVYDAKNLSFEFKIDGFKTAESADDITFTTPNECFIVSKGRFNEKGLPLDYRVVVTVKNTGSCADDELSNVWNSVNDLKKLDIVVNGVKKYQVYAMSTGRIAISSVEFWFQRFEVQFMAVNVNGKQGYSVMKQEYVPEGMSATPPPSEDVPAQRGFVFSEWGTDYSEIVKNTTVSAQYRELQPFWVNVSDYDGSTISDSLYYEGDEVVIPENPEHAGLTFKGWDNIPDVFELKETTWIKATYEAKSNPEYNFTVADYKTAKTVSDLDVQGPNKCFVLQEKSFKQYDEEKDYVEGKEDALQYNLEVSFKIEDTDECSNDSLVNIWKFNIQNKVTSTVKVNGVENVIWNTGSTMGNLHFNYTWFRIQFLDDDRVVSSDGTVIKENTVLKSELVGQGLSATPPENPKLRCKIFKQWDRKYTEVEGSNKVFAEYEYGPSKKVTFKDFDGTVLQDSVYCDDEIVVAPKDPVHKGLTFKGWDKKLEEIENSTYVTATYEVKKAPEYSFTVTNYEKAVKANDANVKTPNNCFIVAKQAFKDLSDGNDYTEGNKDPWRYILEVEVDVADTGSCANDSLANIWRFYSKTDHNLDVMVNTLKAKDLFIQILTIEKIGVKFQYLWYPVVFADYDGKVLKTEIVGEKQAATPPKDPTRSLYKFKGWKFIDEGVGYESISSNMLGRGASINNQITFVADYEKLPTVVVTFLDFNGTLVGKEEILKGASETSVKPPVHAGLTFVGWSKDLNLITKNDSVYAVYKVAATPDFVYTISGLEVGKSSKDLKIKTPNSCFKASVKELYLDNKKYEGKLEAGKYVMYMNLAVSDTDKCADDSLVNIWKTLSQKNINDILVINGIPAYFSGEKLNGEIVYSFELKKSDKESIPGVKMAPQFKLATIGRNIQVMNARKGSAYAVLDMQGNVITSGTVDSANFNVTMSRSGAYVVRVGSVAQLVRVK
ncbi:InlB B-repeat-containing protein [Fibrobacter sp. UWB12]|uniref:InlB B-repeat-containing protein n=1 Tax=Fibrobacter sp. UWB12 TaxID=1896203 RepID=UPI00092479AD|nr:InlB B-repeat-containing protein [Fibrobacter sp. UWB12]SHK33392.1 repeat domain (List_Bact_rpt) [Fibrobacter sp. UWB12]